MNGLRHVFYTAQKELFEQDKIEINEWFHSELKELDSKNIPYDIFIGSYDYDGFNLDWQLNDNSIGGVDIDNGFDFVEYLKNYHENLDYFTVCQLQVRVNDTVDKANMDIIYIEYNGYELFSDRY